MTLPVLFTSTQKQRYVNKLAALFSGSIVALWPQNESAGTVSKDISGHAYNGAYTGVTLGAAGIGDGNTAASFDGTTSFNNVYSAGVAAAFNPTELTVIAWAKAGSSGIWIDGTVRYIFRLAAAATDDIQLIRNLTDNTISLIYRAGSVSKTVSFTSLGGSLSYFCVALTVSVLSDAVIGYLNGVKVGTTQTSLGVWSGALSNTRCAIGAVGPGATNVWSGSIGPVVLLNRAATAAEIAQAATV